MMSMVHGDVSLSSRSASKVFTDSAEGSRRWDGLWSKVASGAVARPTMPSASAPQRTTRGWWEEAVSSRRSNQRAPCQPRPGSRFF